MGKPLIIGKQLPKSTILQLTCLNLLWVLAVDSPVEISTCQRTIFWSFSKVPTLWKRLCGKGELQTDILFLFPKKPVDWYQNWWADWFTSSLTFARFIYIYISPKRWVRDDPSCYQQQLNICSTSKHFIFFEKASKRKKAFLESPFNASHFDEPEWERLPRAAVSVMVKSKGWEAFWIFWEKIASNPCTICTLGFLEGQLVRLDWR